MVKQINARYVSRSLSEGKGDLKGKEFPLAYLASQGAGDLVYFDVAGVKTYITAVDTDANTITLANAVTVTTSYHACRVSRMQFRARNTSGTANLVMKAMIDASDTFDLLLEGSAD